MRLFDSHAHWGDSRFDEDREAALASLRAHSVERVMEIGCDPEGAKKAVELSEKYPFIYAAVGIHPENAQEVTDDDFAAIEKLYAREKVRAVGEIGLDYHYGADYKEIQKEVFARQLELAVKLDLPVCIHDREAHADTLDILRAYPAVRGVFHSYSGSLEMAEILRKMNFVFGFNGIITFKNAKKFEPIIARLHPEEILIETDCPYLAPHPFRGQRNDSRLVYRVAEQIAEIRCISDEEAAEMTWRNACALYGLAP